MAGPRLRKIKSGYCYRARFSDYKGDKFQKYFSGFAKQSEAIAHFAQKKIEYLTPPDNREINKTKEMFNDYVERWFQTSYTRSVAETTAYSSWSLIKNHILPYFTSIFFDEITTLMIDEFYAKKQDQGLSPKTVREIHNLLNRAFGQGVKWGVLQQNPVSEATPPKLQHKEHSLWTKEQTEKFLKVVEGTENEVFYILAIFTGMRRGEILGLMWDDIDFIQGKIYVSRGLVRVKERGLVLRDVKTRKSRRQISISPFVISKLQEHKDKITRMGKLNTKGMVLISSTGNNKDPNNVLREFKRITRNASIPKITIHDLRHLHATMLLKNGENPKVVSERLGHNDVGITLDTYSHVTPDIQNSAALRLEKTFFGERE
ncbi:tyrosine-type recombinase/integrase [Rossellomorea aquimaris]|uniref:tyrosine-type recombinase/integrase n=1 Tax=Rossellomorea aquimaris TaxID=189382 RepID=UPI0006968C95|nr:site-specific integrase [Rossellomorea aquimaris]